MPSAHASPPPIPLRRIEAFLAVAAARNMSHAAAQLDVAQSVVSRHISALEAEVGCRLFERTGRGVSPTAAALELAPRLRAALEDMQRAVAQVAEHGNEPTGLVRVGVVPAAARPLVGMLYQRVAQAYPRIRLQFDESFSTALDERLRHGELDLAVMNRFGPMPRHGEQKLCVIGSLVVGGPKAFARTPSDISFRQMAKLPLVLASRPNVLRVAMDEICRRTGVQIQVVAEADSLLTMKDLILHGGLYTVLPHQAVHEELQAGVLSGARLVKPGLPRTLSLASSTRQPPSSAVRVVSREIREIVETVLVRSVWR